ncbi:MAG: D-2-hydroxyacid dehydrogenase [Spirochaetia bacterium]|nr:D-2-hydroxyacid dehydrogenase [Spirochaetia bacterium]
MNIVILDGYTENPGDLSWEGFEKLGNLTVYDRTDEKDILDRIKDAEIVITNKTPLNEATITLSPSLKYIGILATGYNVVDIVSAKKQNIIVTNIPTYGTAAVAQFAISLLLEVCHHIGEHNRSVQEGKWSNCKDFCYWDYPLIELDGKTIGIIGFGKIGQNVARIASSLGMKILAYDAFQNPELENETCHYATLDTLFANSDVISLHAPLLKETQGIINKENIAKMKDGVIILNNSRGPLIVEEDLREALLSHKVAGAAVDVVSSEPIKKDNPLLGIPNCIITPHISWAPIEARARLMEVAVKNLAAFLKGSPINVVNR